ncbi:MAG: class I SAM-dependent methyltransferase [Dehalobacterium sp.]
MQVKLSKRLAAVAAMVLPGFVTADIGTDHGYLPAYLVMNGVSPSAIASDAKQLPLATAANLISLLALEKKINLRLGDGLSVLQPGESENIVIAGMGASTMVKILEQSPQVLDQTRRLILQPMKDSARIRIWLVKHGWKINDEDLVYEDNIFYEIIAAEPGRSILSPEEAELGPILLKKSHPLLKGLIKEKVRILELIYNSLGNSTKLEAADQKMEIKEKIDSLERVMACL